MRIFRIVGLALAGLVALLLIVLVAVWLLVNPNDYKPQVAEAVQNATGRSLKLDGDIKLSVFPWLALELGPASLGNPPGFGAEPFASVKHVALRVRLRPLLGKRLEIGRIDIDGLDLRLRRDEHGRGNWQSTETAPAGTTSSGDSAIDDLAGLTVTDGRIAYQDTVLDHVNMNVGRVRSGTIVPITLKLDYASGARNAPVHFESQIQLTPDLQAQTIAIPQFSAQFAGARVQGSISGKQILDAPAFTGSFVVAPLALRDFLAQLGIDAPATRDTHALTKLSASGQFTYGANAVRISPLTLTLDDSTLRGDVAIVDLDSLAMTFALAVDRIDVDRYLSPTATARSPGPGAAPAAQAPAQEPALRPEAEGSLRIASATVSGIKLSQIAVGVHAHAGLISLAPVQAQLYGGRTEGSINVDGRSLPSMISIEQNLTSIDVAQLLNDLAKTHRLSGRGNVAARVTTHGLNSAEMTRNLNGRVSAKLNDGALEGVDIGYEIQRAQTLLTQKTLPDGKSSGRTRFDSFQASALISNGVAVTKDINIATPQLRVTGQGSSDLNSQAIDYRINATLLKSAAAAGGNSGKLVEVPVRISGTMTNPVVRPDLAGVAKARVQQEIDKHKDEIKDKLKDQLQNLFKR